MCLIRYIKKTLKPRKLSQNSAAYLVCDKTICERRNHCYFGSTYVAHTKIVL